MTHMTSPGAKLRQAIADENPLQIVGTINAYTAMMAEKLGIKRCTCLVPVWRMRLLACLI
jgi:2-methylisocitrate lyase-like PEP mutase family enzyme